MAAPSISEGWRLKGNQSYHSYQSSTNFQDQRRYLDAAINYYFRSFQTAFDAGERSSAAKNYGTALWKLSEILVNINETQALIEFSYRQAINYFSKATIDGGMTKTRDWKDNLAASFGQCVGRAIQQSKCLVNIERVRILERYIQEMSEDSWRIDLYFEMATIISQAVAVALGSGDYKGALDAIHDCYRPIEECKRLAGRSVDGRGEIGSEIRIIEGDLQFHRATAESYQAFSTGDDLLETALGVAEYLSMDLIYDVLDWYKKAVIQTRDVEVEMEAMATSRLGYVYDKVLKMKSKARPYFHLSIQLATSLHPRVFNSESWYVTATETLKCYQDEDIKIEDQEVKEAERQMYLGELETELKDIEAADVGAGPSGLMRHLYAAYPPKDPKHVLDSEALKEITNVKKILLKAIQHYHPDKQDVEMHGKKWSVFCEEITKRLNKYYETYKFAETTV